MGDRLLHQRAQARLQEVRNEKLGAVTNQFDGIHSIQRALRVGSVDRIIAVARLRPHLIDAVERGMQRALRRVGTIAADAERREDRAGARR